MGSYHIISFGQYTVTELDHFNICDRVIMAHDKYRNFEIEQHSKLKMKGLSPSEAAFYAGTVGPFAAAGASWLFSRLSNTAQLRKLELSRQRIELIDKLLSPEIQSHLEEGFPKDELRAELTAEAKNLFDTLERRRSLAWKR